MGEIAPSPIVGITTMLGAIFRSGRLGRTLLALAIASLAAPAAFAASPDHHEFEATLEAPYTGARGSDAREFVLRFSFPDALDPNTVAWRLELADANGIIVRTWHGEERLFGAPIEVNVPWDGRARAKRVLPDGHYRVTLHATAGDPVVFRSAKGPLAKRVDQVLAEHPDHVQEWDVEVGKPRRPEIPAFAPLPVGSVGDALAKSQPATASLPYTVYFGNLHTQSNDSDGGGAIGSCTSSQPAQSGQFGPNDGFAYAKGRGLDITAATEHNHYFDGSSGTNSSANPTTAKNRYTAGLNAASSFNAANPGFLAVYGMEWGVIGGGGHMNIFNSAELLAWEYNGSGQLIGHTFTAKNDYAALYTLMQSRGWIGQFNHPSSSTSTSSRQFVIGNTELAFHAAGNEVMVLSEIMNTSAFSSNTTETEGSRSMYEAAWKKLLERGYHVAPATNQDNHCANWGASYTNRTGVLIPTGTTLTQASFVAALRARRVYATMDKNSQLILVANGRVMGETFSNSGPLTLTGHFANTAGRTVSQAQIWEGVPGRNGTVTLLASTASTTITPSVGAHFYYAKFTQDDGKILWSAPIWVNQTAGGGDTTPPTVSASESGISGTITLSATASDNVGVTRVEFLIDNVLRGSDSTSPYSMTFDSTTLTNGSHQLVARAYDAANNSTPSTAVGFSIDNTTATVFNEAESNGSVAAANTVARTYTGIRGTMGNTTDKDYFRLTLNANETLKIDMTGPVGSSYDYDLFLVNGSDANLRSSTGGTTTETLTYTNGASAQTVYAKVIAYSGSSTTMPYDLVLTYTAGGGGGSTELILNPGFESGSSSWTATSGVITNDSGQAARTGTWKAWLNGYGSAHTDTLYQQVAIPSSATSVTLRFWLKIPSSETTTTQAYDTLKVQVRNTSNGVLSTLATYSNLNKGTSYVQRTFDLTPWKGRTVRVFFEGIEGSSVATSFVIDDVSVVSQ